MKKNRHERKKGRKTGRGKEKKREIKIKLQKKQLSIKK